MNNKIDRFDIMKWNAFDELNTNCIDVWDFLGLTKEQYLINDEIIIKKKEKDVVINTLTNHLKNIKISK